MTNNKNNQEGEKHSSKCEKKPCTCDGYHTFSELYDHRIRLYIELCFLVDEVSSLRGQEYVTWKSKKHSDGSEYEGWFVLGINKPYGEQVTYHLPNKYWDELFSIDTLDLAPEFDGHTPDDVLERLKLISKP